MKPYCQIIVFLLIFSFTGFTHSSYLSKQYLASSSFISSFIDGLELDLRPEIYAHRGAVSNDIDENTFESIQYAFEKLKVKNIEFDIHFSKEGIPVIHHDHMIDNFEINKLSISEIKSITLKKGNSIPTLEEVLIYFNSKDLKNFNKIIIELKGMDDDTIKSPYSEETLSGLVDLLMRFNNLHSNISLISFYQKYFPFFRKKLPEDTPITLGWLFDEKTGPKKIKKIIKNVHKYQADLIVVPHNLQYFKTYKSTRSFIDLLKMRNISTAIYPTPDLKIHEPIKFINAGAIMVGVDNYENPFLYEYKSVKETQNIIELFEKRNPDWLRTLTGEDQLGKYIFKKAPLLYQAIYRLNLVNTRYLNGFIVTDHNRSIFWQRWIPKGEVKSIAIITHGYKKHSAQYAELASHLTKEGVAVYLWDLEGHGLSDYANELGGHIKDPNHYASGLLKLVSDVVIPESNHYPKLRGKKIHLIGQSLGATVIMSFYQQFFELIPYYFSKSLIMIAPFLNFHPEMFKNIKKIIPSMAFYFSPFLAKVVSNVSSSAPDLRGNPRGIIKNDPLVLKKTTLGWVGRVNNFLKEVREVLITENVLFLLASNDKTVDYTPIYQSNAKQVITIPESSHALIQTHEGRTIMFPIISQHINRDNNFATCA